MAASCQQGSPAADVPDASELLELLALQILAADKDRNGNGKSLPPSSFHSNPLTLRSPHGPPSQSVCTYFSIPRAKVPTAVQILVPQSSHLLKGLRLFRLIDDAMCVDRLSRSCKFLTHPEKWISLSFLTCGLIGELLVDLRTGATGSSRWPTSCGNRFTSGERVFSCGRKVEIRDPGRVPLSDGQHGA